MKPKAPFSSAPHHKGILGWAQDIIFH